MWVIIHFGGHLDPDLGKIISKKHLLSRGRSHDHFKPEIGSLGLLVWILQDF